MGWGRGTPLGQTHPSMGLVLGVLVSVCIFKAKGKARPGSRRGKKANKLKNKMQRKRERGQEVHRGQGSEQSKQDPVSIGEERKPAWRWAGLVAIRSSM